MRNRNWIAIGTFAAFALSGALPGALSAQGRSQLAILRVVVPSVIRVVVDSSAQGSGEEPRFRVLTNDPALRAALATRGVPRSVRSTSALGFQAPSHHAKGAEALEAGPDAAPVALYTIVSP